MPTASKVDYSRLKDQITINLTLLASLAVYKPGTVTQLTLMRYYSFKYTHLFLKEIYFNYRRRAVLQCLLVGE